MQQNVLIITGKNIKIAIYNTGWGVAIFRTFYKINCQFNVCVLNKLLQLSIGALSGKELKEFFKFILNVPQEQQNAVSRAKCRRCAAG